MTSERMNRDDKLRLDHARLAELRRRSAGLVDFELLNDLQPPDSYLVTLHCTGVGERFGEVFKRSAHEVAVYHGPAYPFKPPDLIWRTPIYHPNIVQPTPVCILGGWGPSTTLDELCLWLWEMACYRLYSFDMVDKSNTKLRDWVLTHEHEFPLDQRDLRAVLFAGAEPGRAPSADGAGGADGWERRVVVERIG